jgi:predicted dehydrogenase
MSRSAQHQYRLGMVGLGLAGMAHYVSLWSYPEVEIVAACRRNETEVKSFCYEHGIPGCYTSLEDMLEHENLDALIIATSHNALAQHLRAAITKCKAVLVEKPMATSLAEAKAIEADYRAHQARVVVGYPRRYRNHYIAAARWMNEGRIGPLISAVCEWTDDYITRYNEVSTDPQTFRSDPVQAVRGALLDSGSHMLDALLWLTGLELTAVAAFARESQPGIDVAAALILHSADGVLVTASLYPSYSGRRRRRILITGSKGNIEVDDEKAILVNGDEDAVVSFQPGDDGPVKDLLRLLAGKPATGCAVPEALRVVGVLDAAYRSAAEGRVVEIAG